MPVSLEELVANLAERQLPAIAITVHQVNQLLDDPNTSNLDLQETISLDPGLTMEIYRLYAATAGERRGPASNVAHAISMLGPMPLKAAINNIPVLNTARPAAAENGQFICYSRALHAAMYARSLGEMHQDKNPDEMGHAALLYNCGEMALWKYATKAMQKIHDLVLKGADYGSASQSILGFTLDQLSIALAKTWGLPPVLIECLETKWHQLSRPNAVILANSIAITSANGWHNDESSSLIEFLADLYHQPKNRLDARLHSLSAEIAHRLDGYPLPVSAYNTLLEKPITIIKEPVQKAAKESPAAPRKVEKKKKTVVPIAERPVVAAKPKKEKPKPTLVIPAAKPKVEKNKPKEIPTTKPIEKKPVQTGVTLEAATPVKKPNKGPKPELAVAELEAKKEKPKALDLEKPKEPEHKPAKASVPMVWKESLSGALREIRRELGLRRVLFARLSSDRKSVSVAHVLGADIYSKLNKFSVSLKSKNLFGLLLSKQQGVWLNQDNRDKLLPLIPEDIADALDQRSFFCMSVFVDDSPVGFVYADGREAMNEENYVKFKHMCSELGSTLKQK